MEVFCLLKDVEARLWIGNIELKAFAALIFDLLDLFGCAFTTPDRSNNGGA
jgi:hypothetical protein